MKKGRVISFSFLRSGFGLGLAVLSYYIRGKTNSNVCVFVCNKMKDSMIDSKEEQKKMKRGKNSSEINPSANLYIQLCIQ